MDTGTAKGWNWIVANREWLFSGVGVAAFAVVVRLSHTFMSRRRSLQSRSPAVEPQEQQSRPQPDIWQGIRPAGSKYYTVTETVKSIPAGSQTVSLEYDVDGHAYPLSLIGGQARAEIQFSCHIVNPYKAVHAANEYAMNVLPAKFMIAARPVLEGYSLKSLRHERARIANDLSAQLAPIFDELGMQLEAVRIGAVERIRRGKNGRA